MTSWASRGPVIACSVYQGPPHVCQFSISLPLLQAAGIEDSCDILWGEKENSGQCVIQPGDYYKLMDTYKISPHLRLLRIVNALPDWLVASHGQQIVEHEIADGGVVVTFPPDFLRDKGD